MAAKKRKPSAKTKKAKNSNDEYVAEVIELLKAYKRNLRPGERNRLDHSLQPENTQAVPYHDAPAAIGGRGIRGEVATQLGVRGIGGEVATLAPRPYPPPPPAPYGDSVKCATVEKKEIPPIWNGVKFYSMSEWNKQPFIETKFCNARYIGTTSFNSYSETGGRQEICASTFEIEGVRHRITIPFFWTDESGRNQPFLITCTKQRVKGREKAYVFAETRRLEGDRVYQGMSGVEIPLTVYDIITNLYPRPVQHVEEPKKRVIQDVPEILAVR